MLRKLVLCLLIAFGMLARPASAGEVTVMKPPKDCPQKADLQGHRVLVYVDDQQDCTHDQRRSYGYADDRLGIRFHAPEFGSWIFLPKIVEPVADDPAERAHLCVRAFPDGSVREFIVPLGKPCHRTFTRYSRRYFNGQVCIFPANYCSGIDTLTAEGRRRAQMSIDLALEPAKVAGP